MIQARLRKLAAIAKHRPYVAGLARHRVAAAVEHVEAIQYCAPRTLIDVGANKGQFSLAVRGLFPTTVVHAFEPLDEAASQYEALFAGQDDVHLHRTAIASEPGTVTFHVTDRADSSSLLPPGAGQREAFGVAEQRSIEVPVTTLDAAVDLDSLPHPVLLKIDVQGAELEVLKGLSDLSAIDYVYVEASFVELYEGQCLLADLTEHLAERGFALRGTYNQVSTATFGPTQVDCLFVPADRA
ncbi:FkbM family methyltransferase [Nocardioides sp.]|uniref:FkbM family methyltransferase n=1 Tax=Nocardioides sp. TaxID=35761 RepID=UPI0035197A24